jgi:hypothetical protein
MPTIIGHHDVMKCKKSVEVVTEKVERTQRNTHKAVGKCPDSRDEDAQAYEQRRRDQDDRRDGRNRRDSIVFGKAKPANGNLNKHQFGAFAAVPDMGTAMKINQD